MLQTMKLMTILMNQEVMTQKVLRIMMTPPMNMGGVRQKGLNRLEDCWSDN